jgi:hypothetical protein
MVSHFEQAPKTSNDLSLCLKEEKKKKCTKKRKCNMNQGSLVSLLKVKIELIISLYLIHLYQPSNYLSMHLKKKNLNAIQWKYHV